MRTQQAELLNGLQVQKCGVAELSRTVGVLAERLGEDFLQTRTDQVHIGCVCKLGKCSLKLDICTKWGWSCKDKEDRREDAPSSQRGGEAAPKLTADFLGPRAESKRASVGGTLFALVKKHQTINCDTQPRPKLSAESSISSVLVTGTITTLGPLVLP